MRWPLAAAAYRRVHTVGIGNRNAANSSAANKAAPATVNAAAPAANVAAPVAPAPAPAATAALPEGFPGSDQSAIGANCVVYLGLAAQANARPGGYDGPILEQAAGQWRAGLMIIGGMSEEEAVALVVNGFCCCFVVLQCDQKKSPNVYKSCPK